MMRRSASDLGSRHWFEAGSDAHADDAESNELDVTGEYAAMAALEIMQTLMTIYGMSAKNFCELIYFICKADLSLLKKYGKAPGAATGKYQLHLDRVNGYNRKDHCHYFLRLPLTRKFDEIRGVHDVATAPAHELLAEEFEERPEVREQLDLEIANESLPPAYYRHPVVERGKYDGETVYPYVIYSDAVPYNSHDSAIGIFVYWLISGQRNLSVVLRKRNLCRCGMVYYV